jgi:tRNA threonylcarbamoyladenosine biosynthesis protein TsaE
MQTKTIFVESAQETENIAELIGSKLTGRECIELISDLGGGKTTFTRGLVRGMGIYDTVSSPTFTIGKQYSNNNLTCYHFDFYRLQEPGLVAEELSESISDPNGVIVIEWADSVAEVLPENRIAIEIYRVAENSEHRKIIMKIPEDYSIKFESIE